MVSVGKAAKRTPSPLAGEGRGGGYGTHDLSAVSHAVAARAGTAVFAPSSANCSA